MDRLSSSSFVCKQFAQDNDSNVTQRRRNSLALKVCAMFIVLPDKVAGLTA